MSVILTASKKAVAKPKSAKPKKKKKPSSSAAEGASSRGVFDENETPPQSSNRTAVWHWDCDGRPVTVMLSKDPSVPCDVWTNVNHGTVEEDFDDEDDGVVFKFELDVDGNSHNARIKRTSTGVSSPPFRYTLYVDGDMILEHCQRPTYQEDLDEPPVVDGAYGPGHGPYFVAEAESKKKK